MSNTASFAKVRRIIADMAEELDGNSIVTPDGEVIGNAALAVDDLYQALAYVDILEHRFAPPPAEMPEENDETRESY